MLFTNFFYKFLLFRVLKDFFSLYFKDVSCASLNQFSKHFSLPRNMTTKRIEKKREKVKYFPPSFFEWNLLSFSCSLSLFFLFSSLLICLWQTSRNEPNIGTYLEQTSQCHPPQFEPLSLFYSFSGELNSPAFEPSLSLSLSLTSSITD